MKTIIAGSRTIGNIEKIFEAINSAPWKPTKVVSGAAKGVDVVGEFWAADNRVPVIRFLAEWDTHGKRAGPIRNAQMAEYAEALILVWDGKSRGSANMLENAKKHGLRIHEVVIP